MPTIYTHQTENINKTWLLIGLFCFLIIGLGWLFSYSLNDQFILIGAVIFSMVTSFGSYWYSDKLVLALTGARPIEKKDAPDLYNIVENLCITAGLPLPKIYIINEAQPNAFATGRDEKHAVVAVTVGLLQKLNRAELEGVIAHELSHIGNKDMLLQTMIVVFAGIVALISDWFLRISFWGGGRRDNREEGNLGAILFLFSIIAAILAPLAATLIRLAISRKREFLADASGALLTRYPEGLASALEKISVDPTPMRTAGEATAHLFISSPFKGKQAKNWLVGLFATHPPIEERIARLRAMNL